MSMGTTLTAVPQPEFGAVRLTASATASDAPAVLLDQNAAAMWADRLNWGLAAGAAVIGDALVIPNAAAGQKFLRNVQALVTTGSRYMLEVTLDLGPAGYLRVGSSLLGWSSEQVPSGSGRVVLTRYFTANAGTDHTVGLFSHAAGGQYGVARVRLLSVPANYAFSLVRSDANGVQDVRLPEGAVLAGGGALIVSDFEAALTGPITYTVTTVTSVSATTALDQPEAAWLNVPVQPHHSIRLDLVTGYTEESSPTTTWHEVIGAEYPTANPGPMRRRTGQLEFLCPDYVTARDVRDAYRLGEAMLLRQGDFPGLDLYHRASGSVTLARDTRLRSRLGWTVTVPYREVQRPTEPLAGQLGWNYGADLARNPTYADSAREFPTYAARLMGPAL